MKRLFTGVVVVMFACTAAGCSPELESSEPPKPLSQEALAKLAAADQVDGKVDKVVSKCPACMLSMDGSAKHTSHLEGYTVHSCHQACAAALEKDPEKVLGRLPQ